MERESIDKFFDGVVKNVKTAFGKAVKKTDQLTHIGKLKIDIVSIKREMEKNFTSIGKSLYEIHSDTPSAPVWENETIKNLIKKGEELNERLVLKKDELEHLAHEEETTAEDLSVDEENGKATNTEAPSPDTAEPEVVVSTESATTDEPAQATSETDNKK